MLQPRMIDSKQAAHQDSRDQRSQESRLPQPARWRSCGHELLYMIVFFLGVHSVVLCGSLWHAEEGSKTPGAGTISAMAGEALCFLWRPVLLAWITVDPHYVLPLLIATLLIAAVIWPGPRRQQVTRGTRAAARAGVRLLFLVSSYWSVTTPAGLVRLHLPSAIASQGRWVLLLAVAWLHGVLLQVPPMLHLPLSLFEWWVAGQEFHLAQKDLGWGAPSWQQQLLEALMVVLGPLLLQLAMQHSLWKRPVYQNVQQAAGQQQQQQKGATATQPAAGSSGQGLCRQLGPESCPKTTTAALSSRSEERHVTNWGIAAAAAAAAAPATVADATGCAALGSAPTQPTSTLGSNACSVGASGPSTLSGRDSSSRGGRGGGCLDRWRVDHLWEVPPGRSLLPDSSACVVPLRHTSAMHMLQQQVRGRALPAASQSTAGGGLLSLEDMRYESSCVLTPVSIKVPSQPGVPYPTIAGLVKAAVGSELRRQGLLLHAMTTVPGCVLGLGELVQPAGQHFGRAQQLASGQQQQQHIAEGGHAAWTLEHIVPSLQALQQHRWLVPFATYAAAPCTTPPSAAVVATAAAAAAAATGVAASPEHQAQVPALDLLVQGLPPGLIQGVRQGLRRALALLGPFEQPRSTSGSKWIHAAEEVRATEVALEASLEPQGSPAGPRACASPPTLCVVATWGRPVTLQLMAFDTGSCAGAEGREVEAYRVVAMHHQQVLMDAVVVVTSSSSSSSSRGDSSSGACPSLTFTCSQAPPSLALGAPGVVSLYLIPAAANTGKPSRSDGTNSPPSTAKQRQPCLPAAHVVVLLLPPAPAAELSAWVATRRLPLHLVAAWGADLAVLVGCAEQLQAAAAAQVAAPATGTMERLIATSRLATVAAGGLGSFFSTQDLVAASDLVAVLKQQVLVGATALAPMAAGSVVPAAAAAAAAAAVIGTVTSTRQVVVSPTIHMCVSAAHPVAMSPGQLGPVTTGMPVVLQSMTAATAPGAAAAAASSTGADAGVVTANARSSSSSSSSGGGEGSAPMSVALPVSSHAAPLRNKAAPGACLEAPNPAAAAAGGGNHSSKEALHPLQVPPVEPAESAALSGRWWRAVPLCWRGFRDAGTERSYQVFRAEVLWRWDLVARSCHLTVGLGMLVKALYRRLMLDALVGRAMLPVAAVLVQLAAHVVLLLGARSWWGRRRDALLAVFHTSTCLLRMVHVPALPPVLFCALHGSGTQLLTVPLSFLLSPSSPQTALGCCTCVTALTYTTLLLLAAKDATPGVAGLSAMQAGVRGSSGALVLVGIGFSLVNAAAALFVSLALEVATRRAWLHEQQQQQQQLASCAAAASSAAVGGVGRSCTR